jgi:hypothetical protein
VATIANPSFPGTIAPFSVDTRTVNADIWPTEALGLTLKIRFNSSPLSSVVKLFIDTEIVFSVLAY